MVGRDEIRETIGGALASLRALHDRLLVLERELCNLLAVRESHGETINEADITKAFDAAYLQDEASRQAGVRQGDAESRSDPVTSPSKGSPSGSASARSVRGAKRTPDGLS